MSAIHETAYPRIKPNLSIKELKEVFTPTEEELSLLDSKTKKTLLVTRLGFMIALKCYQYLGRPIKPQKIDVTIKKYLAEKMGINPLIDLTGYSKLTRHRHMKIGYRNLKNPHSIALVRSLVQKKVIEYQSMRFIKKQDNYTFAAIESLQELTDEMQVKTRPQEYIEVNCIDFNVFAHW